MSYSAAHDLKEQVRQATDIVDLLGSYLQLQRKGRFYVALCPWHDDARPSLQVNPGRQTWKCWPCDVGGDVFSFVMRRENIDFSGALKMLAERAGIEITSSSAPKAKPGSPDDKATLYKAIAWAEQQFHKYLLESHDAAAARQYLQSRSITDESIRRYSIGYAPNEWQWLLDRAKTTPFSPSVLEAVGLAIRNERQRVYDRFRGRIMFPIRDPQQRPIALGGRILPELADERAAKYINSPETRLYTKSEQLYGLDVVRDQVAKQRHVLVMEGYTDVVIARQAGIDNVVAVCGTALGPRHIRLLKRYADRVTLVLDGDDAGQKRAAEVLELFIASQVELRIVTLAQGLDPCDCILQNGAEAFNTLVEQAPDALDHHVKRVTSGIDLVNDTHRATQALQQILHTLSRAPRLQDDTTTVLRLRDQQTLSRLSRMFHVDELTLRQQLTNLRLKSKPHWDAKSDGTSPDVAKPLDSWEHELFALLLRHPDALAAVLENLHPADLRTASARALFQVYQDLEASGFVADYQRLMDAIEDATLKNILVELVEANERMEADDSELQLRELLAAFAARRQEKARRQHLADLESGKLAEEEELDLLKTLFASKKHDS